MLIIVLFNIKIIIKYFVGNMKKQAKSPHAFNKILGCELVKPKMQEAFLG